MVKHLPNCHWGKYVANGETPPGQSFWGKLDYAWCQANCPWPESERDKSAASRKIGNGDQVDVLDILQRYQSTVDGSIEIAPFSDPLIQSIPQRPESSPKKPAWKRLIDKLRKA